LLLLGLEIHLLAIAERLLHLVLVILVDLHGELLFLRGLFCDILIQMKP